MEAQRVVNSHYDQRWGRASRRRETQRVVGKEHVSLERNCRVMYRKTARSARNGKRRPFAERRECRAELTVNISEQGRERMLRGR